MQGDTGYEGVEEMKHWLKTGRVLLVIATWALVTCSCELSWQRHCLARDRHTLVSQMVAVAVGLLALIGLGIGRMTT